VIQISEAAEMPAPAGNASDL